MNIDNMKNSILIFLLFISICVFGQVPDTLIYDNFTTLGSLSEERWTIENSTPTVTTEDGRQSLQLPAGAKINQVVSVNDTGYIYGDFYGKAAIEDNIRITYKLIDWEFTEPFVLSGEIGSINDSLVQLTLSEELDTLTPLIANFDLTQGGTSVGIDSIYTDSIYTYIQLDTALSPETTLLLDHTYLFPDVSDNYKNYLSDFTDTTIINNIAASGGSVEVRTYEFIVPSSSGVINWTVPTWTSTPVAAKFEIVRTDQTDGRTASAVFGSGFTDGIGEYSICSRADGGVTPSNVGSMQRDDFCIFGLATDANTREVEAAFSSFISGGIALNWGGTSLSGQFKVIVTFFAGNDVFAHTGEYQPSDHVEDVGFKADLIFVQGIGNGSTSASNYIGHNRGVVTQDNQANYSMDVESGETTSFSISRVMNDICFGQMTQYGGYLYESAISNIDAQGFEATSSATDVAQYLALGFSNSVKMSIDTIPTSGNMAINTIGFTPHYFGAVVTWKSDINSTPSEADIMSGIYEYDGTNDYALGGNYSEGVALEETYSISYDNFYFESGDQTEVIDGSVAFDTEGVDITLTTNPSTQKIMFYWTIE